MKNDEKGVIGLNLDGKEIVGTWNIRKMSEWDVDYISMELQAFIRIDNNGTGEFRFELVHGQLSGGFEKDARFHSGEISHFMGRKVKPE